MIYEPIESERPPTPDVALAAVANEHRRAVLRELGQFDGTEIPLDTLADSVAAQVRADDGGVLADDHRQRIRIALHHTHLPKLKSYGMIDYDTDTRRIRNCAGELERELLAMVESYELGE